MSSALAGGVDTGWALHAGGAGYALIAPERAGGQRRDVETAVGELRN